MDRWAWDLMELGEHPSAREIEPVASGAALLNASRAVPRAVTAWVRLIKVNLDKESEL